MSAPNAGSSGRRPRATVLGVLLVAIASVVAFVVIGTRPRGPKVLNQATPAREVRPLTTDPDPRFDPLPFERENHER